MLNKKNAFTLIELSIVMVIIGLIIGGIISGKELILGAQVRSTVSQIIKYNAAVNTFQIKYQAMPGDFSNASNFIPGAVNGNGDGLVGINGSYGGYSIAPGNTLCNYSLIIAPISVEYINFWSHLSSSNLIEGSYAANNAGNVSLISGYNMPATKINQLAGIFAYGNVSDQINYYQLGLYAVSPGSGASTINFLSGYAAYAIDSKMDDGLPYSGIVIARGLNTNTTVGVVGGTIESQASYVAQTSSSGDQTHCVVVCNSCGNICGSGNPTTYNVQASSSSPVCQLRIRIN
jgi:prepilin-type N-terminal cleavage/methylation domain-containing protein